MDMAMDLGKIGKLSGLHNLREIGRDRSSIRMIIRDMTNVNWQLVYLV